MNKKDVCATKIAYVRFTEDDLADLDNQVRRVGASSRHWIAAPATKIDPSSA